MRSSVVATRLGSSLVWDDPARGFSPLPRNRAPERGETSLSRVRFGSASSARRRDGRRELVRQLLELSRFFAGAGSLERDGGVRIRHLVARRELRARQETLQREAGLST